MRPDVSWIIYRVGNLVAILMLCIGVVMEKNNSLVFGAGLFLLVISYLQAYIFCRCPHCSQSFMSLGRVGIKLYIRVKIPKRCPECKKEMY